jgi:serine/threonine-protein kinase
MQKESNNSLHFGPFRLDLGRRTLTRDHEMIPLSPKAFDLLLVLLENSDRVVHKDELMKALWPNTFVEESNLTQHIFQLRKALGRDGKDRQYIVTLPGRGYRFVERVQEIGADASGTNCDAEDHSSHPVMTESSPSAVSPGNGQAQTKNAWTSGQPARVLPRAVPSLKLILWWAIPGLVIVILAIALAFMRQPTPRTPQSLVRVSLDLPEFVRIQEGKSGNDIALPSVVMSPDGTRIVYTGLGPDNILRLYTRTLDQEQSLPMPGTEDAYGPFFSPDGRNVAFFADGKLKKTSVTQGGATILCDAPKGNGGSWGDGGYIAMSPDLTSPLSLVSSSTGETRQITELKAEARDLAQLWPQVLPGAKAVLFTALSTAGNWSDTTIEAQSLRTRERKTLVRQASFGRYAPSGHLIFLRGSTVYAAPMDLERLSLTGPAIPIVQQVAISPFSYSPQLDFSASGTLVYVRARVAKQELIWLDATGQVRPLRPLAAEYNPGVRISPDGKRIALSLVGDDNVDVWVYDWGRDAMIRLTTNAFAWFPAWTPDGNHIAFTSGKDGGAPNVYYTRSDGTGEIVRLTHSEYRQIPFSFSPDGKRLAFVQFGPQTKADIWILPLDGARSDHPKPDEPQPFLVTSADERIPMISPDGHWLAYQSDESGPTEVWVRPFPGPGSKWQISMEGGDRPVWSRRGPTLFYRSTQGIMAVDYSANHGAFVSDKPRLWSAKSDLGNYFDATPDGMHFVVLRPAVPDQSGSERVILLQNFFDELRRRIP